MTVIPRRPGSACRDRDGACRVSDLSVGWITARAIVPKARQRGIKFLTFRINLLWRFKCKELAGLSSSRFCCSLDYYLHYYCTSCRQ